MPQLYKQGSQSPLRFKLIKQKRQHPRADVFQGCSQVASVWLVPKPVGRGSPICILLDGRVYLDHDEVGII